MKGKLIILVGISNSGKSTYASNMVQYNPTDYVRINRDDIRNLLFGYNDETISNYYKRDDLYKLEKQVTRFEDTLIYDGLELGKTVIVDATHLKRAYLERFKYWNVPTKVIFFDIELKEAIKRDNKRSRKVGSSVIKKQFDQYKTLKSQLDKEPIDFTPIELDNNEDKPYVFVFDIDGTLADKGDRSPYEWHKVGNDKERNGVCAINRFLSQSFKAVRKEYGESYAPSIIIATGRDGVCLPETEQWLDDCQLRYDGIYIRPKGDSRPDWLIKREMAEEITKDYHIAGWFDDRLQVSRHLRMLGLEVYNVAHGNF